MDIQVERVIIAHAGEGVIDSTKEQLQEKLGNQIRVRTTDIQFLQDHLELFNPELLIFLPSISKEKIENLSYIPKSLYRFNIGEENVIIKTVNETVPSIATWNPEPFLISLSKSKVM